MSNDIVTRLRMPVAGNYDDELFPAGPQPCARCCEAADEIERLRAIINDCWDWETVLAKRGETL